MRTLMVSILVCASVGAQADSLFSESGYVGLVSDARSRNVGEALTVLIYEQASSTTSADREISKDTGLRGSLRTTDDEYRGDLDLDLKSNGGGSISRSGQLVAAVSVTIQEVLPNGELYIAGEQLIEFNEETQFIQLKGRVRPEDIGTDNSVLSTRLADAEITYKGHGLLGRSQREGVLTRLVGWLF